MEVTDENLATLANYLQQTLNPDPNIRRPAEKFLEGVEVNQNYAILLLHLIDKDAVDQTIRVAAAIVFKNYIKRNWPVDEDGVDRIHSSDRATIKTLIVSLMLKSPESIQRQFSDAVSIIGKCDFPDKWPSLIPEMVEKFNTGDFHVINGVLRTAHSLFKRYRYEFKSQRLWEEIKHVLDNFAKPLTDLFVATIDLASKHADNPQALRVIYGSLVLICKVFYSLNCQDLPEFFEDNMGIWMPNLLNLLQVKVPCLEDPQEDEKPGVLEQLRTEICECCALYALKYEEEFTAHAPPFVTAAWGVLLATTPQTKYDALVSNGLNFLAKIAEKNIYKNLFEDPATLSSICEKVVIPNIEFRESDMELFEDNPEEYVRRDIEGSDVDTRRRAACDLVKTLSVHFEANMMAIFGQYVQLMLQKYSAEGAAAWRCKDTALYLVTSLAARGATQAAGVTRASPLVDLAQFAQTNVVTELQGAETQLPVIRADAMKYLMTFRSLLPKELLVSTIPLLINHIKVPGVVCTYAACTIEKLIGGGVATREHIEPHAASLLAELLQAIEPTHNEYVMKAFLRTVTCLGDASLQYLGAALPALARLLAQVAKNPSKPHFNHYLFETLSLSVKLVTKANPSAVSAFEDALFPIFQEILQNDVQEFMPYVFQMLSLLLELGGGAGASGGAYRALWGSVVAPPLWERAGHVRALVRLLCALVAHDTQAVREKGRLVRNRISVVAPPLWERAGTVRALVRLLCALVAHDTQAVREKGRLCALVAHDTQAVREKGRLEVESSVVAPPLWERTGHVRLLCALVAHDTQAVREKGRLSAVLGVFQKLIASKTNDHEGFYLVQTLLYKLGMQDLEPYIKQIMTLLFQRLSSSKTTKYVKGLIAFLGFFAAHFGADNLIEIVESVQPNMFSMYVQRILIPDVQKVSGTLERKAAAVGCVKLLCESAAFRGPLAPMWTPLMQGAQGGLREAAVRERRLPGPAGADVDAAHAGRGRGGAVGGRRGGCVKLLCESAAFRGPLAPMWTPLMQGGLREAAVRERRLPGPAGADVDAAHAGRGRGGAVGGRRGGCVKLLCESAAFRGPLAPMWTPLMQVGGCRGARGAAGGTLRLYDGEALISVFELPCDESSLPDDHFVEVDDAPGYQAAYSQLSCAKPPSQDPLESISSPQQYLAESLGAMARANPGLLPQKLSELEEPHRAALQMYLNKYSVQVC
ncbi:unnamed protein product [Plutella xylostella]|uniref:Exportin-2 n=1 Tax=Plutella xylostella TaxID=51655 RepID=A0A8S4F8X3_PLUXY|nr:unnamed protein product [Plutella xylostella]